uniref:Uncharacterized protein n=1 Tax=uncultured prokaryote TaxID=198431 RepID=A0A0H5Q457_9ZZZZ|nr:hypothetical protein [uncultured prokaryote]
MAEMYKIQWVWGGVAGTPWVQTTYWDAVENTDPQPAVDAIEDFLNATKTSASTAVYCNVDPQIPIVDSDDGSITGFSTATTTQISGSGSGDMMASANQVNVQLRTDVVLNNRRLLGHLYMPGRTAAIIYTNGRVDPSTVSGIDSVMPDLISGTGYQMVVYSKANHALAPATAGFTQSEWAVLRSRRD